MKMGMMKRYHWFGVGEEVMELPRGGSSTPPRPQSSERVQLTCAGSVREVILGHGQLIGMVEFWIRGRACMQGGYRPPMLIIT